MTTLTMMGAGSIDLMKDRLSDHSLMPLPHPIRVDAAFGSPFDTGLFESLGIMKAVRPYLTDAATPTEWIINHVPGMQELAMVHLGLPGATHLGVFMLMMIRARLRAHGDPILEVTPPLQALLAETDLQNGLPVRFFRSPHPLVYLAFARPNPLRVPNRLSGLHECEGAYIGMYPLPPHHPLLTHTRRTRALRLDPAKPTRAIELLITGSPVSKANVLDDASQDLMLLIQDEDEDLSAVLERHIAFFTTPEASYRGAGKVDPNEVAMIRPVIYELAKVLLYLNLAEVERLPRLERTDLERHLRQFGKLTARRRERLARVYDRTLIGPPAAVEIPVEAEAARADGARTVRPHWRRGHFRRIHYGEGLSDSRIGWIRPTLVKAAEAFGLHRPKPEG